MIFSLDVLRARKGDCLLLHWGDKADPRLVMIDGGPANVYGPHLKPRLAAIKQKRAPGAPLPVDVLMVSHVDDDHIRGILDLTRELTAAGTQAPLVRVASFWHNSFDEVIDNDPGELTASVASTWGAASLDGGLPADAAIDLGRKATGEQREIAEATLLVLASIEQGHRLRNDAEALQWPRNPEFDGKLIRAGKQAVDLGGLKLTVAGPMLAELKALQKKHAEWLKTREKKTDEAALAAYVDRSVPNLSSIVVMAECGGKRMLLTGDARGDKILKGLESVGLLAKGGKLHVELLKVPHHGSAHNLKDDFFQRITAEHYVFSGNGEHGNPERESLEMLFRARGKAAFHIHLTYPVREIDAARKADWEQNEQAAWSPATQGLAALLRKKAPGQKVHIVGDTRPHVIDLLERLGY